VEAVPSSDIGNKREDSEERKERERERERGKIEPRRRSHRHHPIRINHFKML